MHLCTGTFYKFISFLYDKYLDLILSFFNIIFVSIILNDKLVLVNLLSILFNISLCEYTKGVRVWGNYYKATLKITYIGICMNAIYLFSWENTCECDC